MTLQTDIQAVISQSRIEAGVAVWHVETGEQVDINGGSFFPMASVFKIPVLAVAGQRLAAGTMTLEERVTLTEEAKSTGSGILRYFQPGVSPTFRDLLTLMMIISDNTATDMNVALLGGAVVVEAAMHELGLNDIYLKMDCKGLLKSLFPPGIRDMPLEQIKAWSDEHDIVRDGLAFSLTPENNVSTALAMTKLVYMLFTGQIVQGAVKDEVLDIMYKQTLNQRLPRFLPSNVPFAHKTGTIGGIANDSGVITIGEHNHAVVTMYTSWNDHDYWQQPEARYARLFEVESAIGRVGRLVYDYFRENSA